MRTRAAVAGGLIAAALTGYAGGAWATPGSGFTAAQQWRAVFDELDVRLKADDLDLRIRSKDDADVYVTRNEIAVGGQSGWHTHPGPSLIMVTAGEVTAYASDDPTCTPVTYRAGQGFLDSGDGQVHLLRNEGAAPAETVAVQFLPLGATRRIDAPAPARCTP